MKQIIVLLLPIGLFFLLSSYIIKTDNFKKAKDIEKEFVPINDKMLLGKYEVSNADYRRFMGYLKDSKQSDLYRKCLLDTTQWAVKPAQSVMKDKYHTVKAFDNYPVVTISYDAANEYCKWLTVQYNSDPAKKFKKVAFRLPTEQEWTEAASGGDKHKLYPWNSFYLRNNKGEYLCNFLRIGDQAISYDEQTKSYKVEEEFIENVNKVILTAPVDAFSPSPSGIFNLSGNAAEMVAEKGLAKGGSYNDPGYNVRINSKKHYVTPSPEIGFRVLMEIVEK